MGIEEDLKKNIEELETQIEELESERVITFEKLKVTLELFLRILGLHEKFNVAEELQSIKGNLDTNFDKFMKVVYTISGLKRRLQNFQHHLNRLKGR